MVKLVFLAVIVLVALASLAWLIVTLQRPRVDLSLLGTWRAEDDGKVVTLQFAKGPTADGGVYQQVTEPPGGETETEFGVWEINRGELHLTIMGGNVEDGEPAGLHRSYRIAYHGSAKITLSTGSEVLIFNRTRHEGIDIAGKATHIDPAQVDEVTRESPQGSVVRHAGPSKSFPAASGKCIDAITDHITMHFGEPTTVLHEIVSDLVHVDIHIVDSTEAFPFLRMVTSGMSDLPMGVPEKRIPKHIELMMTLPKDWKLDRDALREQDWYWPVALLQGLARLPHQYNTWFGYGHTIPNGDPPEAYASNTMLCGALILPSPMAPDEFHTLQVDERKQITFYSVIPLYSEEMEFKLRFGLDALLNRFDEKGITDIVDPRRPNAII